jgi:hypothetical protein
VSRITRKFGVIWNKTGCIIDGRETARVLWRGLELSSYVTFLDPSLWHLYCLSSFPHYCFHILPLCTFHHNFFPPSFLPLLYFKKILCPCSPVPLSLYLLSPYLSHPLYLSILSSLFSPYPWNGELGFTEHDTKRLLFLCKFREMAHRFIGHLYWSVCCCSCFYYSRVTSTPINNINSVSIENMTQDGSVSIVTTLQSGRSRNRLSNSTKRKIFFSSPQLPHRLRGPPSLLSSWYPQHLHEG